MNPDYITIILYKLKPNAPKIQAIKMVRAMGCLYGGKIGLKDAKNAVDNILTTPIKVRCKADYAPIIQCGIDAYFVTTHYEPEPMWLDSIVEYPLPEPLPNDPWLDRAIDSDPLDYTYGEFNPHE